MTKTLEEIIQREPLNRVGWELVTIDKKTFVGLWGNRCSEVYDNKEDARKDWLDNQWTYILAMIIGVLDREKR